MNKNGENLKIPLEIFCSKLYVSNIISAFLGHLKPKIFFAGQQCLPTLSTRFQNLWIRPYLTQDIKQSVTQTIPV